MSFQIIYSYHHETVAEKFEDKNDVSEWASTIPSGLIEYYYVFDSEKNRQNPLSTYLKNVEFNWMKDGF